MMLRVTEKEVRIKIPRDRIGVLIGSKGEVKRGIEEEGKVKIEVDSDSGEVIIAQRKETEDPLAILKAGNVVKAIGRGFTPEKAFKLFRDDVFFEIIDLRDYVGKSRSDLQRIKGRIIGEGGRTRRIIEELTNTDISIYGRTLSIIGEDGPLRVAKEALTMLLSGSQHGTVYRFLHRKKEELKRYELEVKRALWEESLQRR